VKPLLDQNLSPRLGSGPADLFPGSVHVREAGLREAPDDDIWRYAAEHGYVIASKDSDYRQLSFVGRQQDRLARVQECIPDNLVDRLLVIGVRTEPEVLGQAMAEDCREETDTTWGRELLRHNAGEIDRLRQHVRPFLFRSA